MGTKFLEVMCDVHGIGGNGEYCGAKDAQFGRINVFYLGASDGKYIPRALLMDLDPCVVGAVALSRRSASCFARENS
jgi:tubulin beta